MPDPVIYLDHNATTAVEPEVLERFIAVEREYPANPDSLHAKGRQARAVLEQAREDIAAALAVVPDEIFFTSGGTESNNMVVAGLGDPSLPVLAGVVEHASVLEPAKVRSLIPLAVDHTGRVMLAEPVTRAGLLCLVQAQNEVGTLQPVEQAAELARQLSIPLHLDLAQGLGRLPLQAALALCDSATLTSHKCGGLKGVGILFLRGGAQDLRPMVRGGAQERSLRPGTSSPALAAATAVAVRLAVSETDRRADRMRALRDRFVADLSRQVPVRCLTPHAALPNTAMLLLDVPDGRMLLPALDMAGVAVSQGSACSSGSPRPPEVLLAMGLTEDDARRCVRFSFGHHMADEECAQACARVATVVKRLAARAST